ncbi:quinoprotein dehydrogenase-associated SoxYZ-like carrier [Novispirillum sp. DQ9]|uniref:quinoprotein dehydrogenase-associated SoxYZ-like carrier n=1 Tax=Novispirillum sp. DQ9 TaxID=3398612 RepID=UPI003C7AB58C
MRRWLALLVPLCLMAGPARAEEDPLGSVLWDAVRGVLFADAAVVFDDRVQVFSPPRVEDTMDVPVEVAVEGLPGVTRIVVFADHNPIPRVLTFEPQRAQPRLSLRMKVQEATPIRAAALTADGVWHVGGLRVDAAGGGCTTPTASQASKLWETALNQVQARQWTRPDGGTRLRVRILHPMDTGLADGIPAMFIEDLRVTDLDGAPIARLYPAEPVSENPVFTFDLAPGVGARGVLLSGRDNQGNELAARVAPADGPFGLLEGPLR